MGQELQGKTLGVLGLGKIGSVLAKRAMSFEMNVVAYDPFVTEQYAKDLGVELLRLDEVLKRCDFLSLHLPVNEKTHRLISKGNISRMKPTAAIINTARGKLISEEDLAEALEQGRLSGAALDVFENEPQINPRLVSSDKVILTPHIAGSTEEAQAKVGYDIAVQIADYLLRDAIVNAVNFPSISPKDLAHVLPYAQLGERLGALISQICGIRVSEIGIRYYGDLTQINYKPITNYILKAVLAPMLSDVVNEVNALSCAKERGILVRETVSSRERSYSNLISIQLVSPEGTEWVEGAILRHGSFRLVSVDGIPVESQLGGTMLLIRNDDTPGVIGQVGTILGDARVNIASFVLGRGGDHPHAVGIASTDSAIPADCLERIRAIPAVKFAQVVEVGA
jgi:D-3-phosphoglycerate dehydrogenase